MPGLPQQIMAARSRYVKEVAERHDNADAEALRRVARRAVLCYAAAQATREMRCIAYQQEMAMTNVSIEENVVIHHVGGRALTVDIFRYQ